MRCITLHQPWASAMFVPRTVGGGMLKRIETRGWRPAEDMIGERLAIAAGKADTPKLRAWWMEHVKRQSGFRACFEKMGFHDWTDLPRGAVLGHGRLARVESTEKLRVLVDSIEQAFGDYTAGRFGWVIEDLVVLPQPVPIVGRQGIYWWDEKEVAAHA